MYMTPNGRVILSDKEKKAASKVLGTNTCTGSCKGCNQKKKKK